MAEPRPPKWAEGLLRRLLPEAYRDHQLGDLAESASLWSLRPTWLMSAASRTCSFSRYNADTTFQDSATMAYKPVVI